ncbi:MAG: 1,2-diacylglycerol 3-alpha-glucosyltransferase, partial [Abditibacteriota bacterium]|nr:1,2-diacylglycerol 3-alpha-glucosyltransferase [Abditibacteriota bacterium]
IRPGVPTTVLPTGIDLAKFGHGDRAIVRARHGIEADEKILLYVGRIVLEKNLVFLIRTLAPILLDRTQRTRLMMVGGGPNVEDLKVLCEQLALTGRVIFTDFVDPKLIADYYAASDIFTFASRTETQGVSIAEALASGLPCVVVGVMGAAEALRDGQDGYVVPPREDAFRNAVQKLLDDEPLRHRMAQSAIKNATRLSCESAVERLLCLYDELRTNRSTTS